MEDNFYINTVTYLCVPVRTKEGKIIGAVEAINKYGAKFTCDDEEMLMLIASQAGIMLENDRHYMDLSVGQKKIHSIFEVRLILYKKKERNVIV